MQRATPLVRKTNTMPKKQQFPAPPWGQELSSRYLSGIAHAFLLHGNVQDYVVTAGQTLKNYLLGSFAGRDVIVYWHRAGGFYFPSATMKKRFAEVVGLASATSSPRSGGSGLAGAMNAMSGTAQAADPLAGIDQTKPLVALGLLNKLLHVKAPRMETTRGRSSSALAGTHDETFRAAVIIDYAETVVPQGDSTSAEDRTALVFLDEIGRDVQIGELQHIVVAITSDLHDMHERLRRSGARWEQIEIPFPSFEERGEFVRALLEDEEKREEAGYVVRLADGLTCQDVARLTTGLRSIDLEDILLRASYQQQPISMALVKARKDEIVASEFEEVLQIVENEFGFESLGGMDEIKEDLRENVVRAMRSGEYRVVPQGILFMGPAGTGKTRLAKALAKEAGVTFVELQPSKIFSKWVGDTERRLERALTAIKAMTPCVVFIDEIDQAVSRGEGGDNGVSNRVFKRLMEVMADTSWRGKILWVGASNRPDLLDAALLRPGRLDKKIPILAPDEKERASILQVLTLQAFPHVKELPTTEQYLELAREMIDYTGAEIEAVVGKATQLYARSGSRWSIAQALREAFDRIIPSTQNIEQMTRLALLYCNDLDLVPSHLRELARAVRKPASVNDEEQETQLPQARRSRRDNL